MHHAARALHGAAEASRVVVVHLYQFGGEIAQVLASAQVPDERPQASRSDGRIRPETLDERFADSGVRARDDDVDGFSPVLWKAAMRSGALIV